MIDMEKIDEICKAASASFMRTMGIGTALLELAQSGFENPMVWAWQLDVLAPSHAEAIEEAVESSFADLELARSAGSTSITPGPFPLEKVEEITRKILGMFENAVELPPECFNAIADCIVRHALPLFSRTDMWIPWEVAKADLQRALDEYHSRHPEGPPSPATTEE